MKKTFEVSDYLGNLLNGFFYDAQNNVLLGMAIWYNPFGKQDSVIVTGTAPHRFTYNCKELDQNFVVLDRYYYGARYYDPQLGRFMTPDPIKDDWTPYSYCRNNPIMYNDPTGMMASGGGFDWGGERGPRWNFQSKDPMSWDNMQRFTRFATLCYFAGVSVLQGGGGSSGGNTSAEVVEITTSEISENDQKKLLDIMRSFLDLIDYVVLKDMFNKGQITVSQLNGLGEDVGGMHDEEGHIALDIDMWNATFGKLDEHGKDMTLVTAAHLAHEFGHVTGGEFRGKSDAERYLYDKGSNKWRSDMAGYSEQNRFYKAMGLGGLSAPGNTWLRGLRSAWDANQKGWPAERRFFNSILRWPRNTL